MITDENVKMLVNCHKIIDISNTKIIYII